MSMILKQHKVVFSKSVAARLVGGRARLLKLITEGRIEVEKPTNRQNGKWFCDAGDVIRYMAIRV
ncbi:MAG: hypothetical protein HDS14_08430 [Bacteroides sp.]|nr:hypothetical protein [Bacteroides sp.]